MRKMGREGKGVGGETIKMHFALMCSNSTEVAGNSTKVFSNFKVLNLFGWGIYQVKELRCLFYPNIGHFYP